MIPVKPCPLPLLIRAASLANFIRAKKRDMALDIDSPEWLTLYLQEDAKPLDAAFFRAQLDAGCLLELDGIDEVPGQMARKATARMLERAARMFPKTHIDTASKGAVILTGAGGSTLTSGCAAVPLYVSLPTYRPQICCSRVRSKVASAFLTCTVQPVRSSKSMSGGLSSFVRLAHTIS